VAKAKCGEVGSSGGPFIGGRGRGSEVASTGELATVVMMAHSGDGMARAGARRQGRKAPNLAGERVNGEAMGRAAAGGDRVNSRSWARGES
jgi:hypothetical protein